MNATGVSCDHKNFIIIDREETYPVRGENVTITAKVKICSDCGKEIFDYSVDGDNLRKAFLKYKKKHALLGAAEIIALRKRYNISQRTLAKLIGCSQATVVRYEKGDIQNNTHNSVLKMLEKPENFSELVEIKEDELDPNELKNINKSLGEVYKDSSTDVLISNTLSRLCDCKADQFSGFIEFDYNKFSQIVHYYARIVNNLYKTKLLKLLWFTDMYFFREYTTSMSGMRYIHQHYGPVPEQYSLLLGLMERTGKIHINEVDTPYGCGEIISPEGEGAYSFSKEEQEVLDLVYKKFGSMTAKEISEFSHKQSGYVQTSDMELISYVHAMEMD